jgi:COP9 signalosome complex subunit 1
VAPGDIAIYGTLCALATLSRNAIKAQLLENATFAVYLEHEPYVRELIGAYMGSDFKTALQLLSRYSVRAVSRVRPGSFWVLTTRISQQTRHYLDMHLARHLHDLTILIRSSAVVLYFQPFTSIRLERMGKAFGWSVDEVEHHVVALIQAGQIHGRVDSQNKASRCGSCSRTNPLTTPSLFVLVDPQSQEDGLPC